MPLIFPQMRCVMQGRARDGAQITEFLYWDSSIACHLPQVILRLPLQSRASQRRNNCCLLPWEKQLGIGIGRKLSPGCPFKWVLSACVSTTCPLGYRASRLVAPWHGTSQSCFGLGLSGRLQASPELNCYRFQLLVYFSHF